MKIDTNLLCLIGALATGITDGRISSSSSTQRVGGSAMEVTPNRRELEPLQYCTAIDKKTGDGKQRGVVDWQNFDQCKKCEGGQPWWPCDGNLCIGFCTPKDVCDERILRLEAAAAATTSTAADCTAVIVEKNVLEETIESLRETKYCSYMASIDECQEKEDFQAFRDKIRQEIEEEEETSAATGSDCSAVNEDNNSLRAKILELEKVIEILDPDESEGC